VMLVMKAISMPAPAIRPEFGQAAVIGRDEEKKPSAVATAAGADVRRVGGALRSAV